MTDKNPLDEAKRERALKLLGESVPETAKTLREALKNRSKRKDIGRPWGDEVEDPLKVHSSFWTNGSFIKWQLLKRNKNYEYWTYDLFWDNREFFRNHFAKLIKSYRPKEGEPFLAWEGRVRRKTLSKLIDLDMQWEIAEKSVVWRKMPPSLPERWIPIPIEIGFPHPRLLSLLTASTVGLAVTTVPFEGMRQIQLRSHPLWVDLTKTWQEIQADIRSYESHLGIKNEWEMTEVLFEAKKQLAVDLQRRKRNSTPKRTRSRKRDSQPPRIARILAAWDLKQNGKSYAQICKELWPEDASRCSLRDIYGNPSSLLKRARDHVRDAERLIQSAFSC